MINSQLLSNNTGKMFQNERISAITDILKQNGYVTVKYLTEVLHYSNATINRDLNIMEKQNLVKRSYGGVELVQEKGTPLPFRYEKMKPAKRKIAQKAAEFVQDGDTIFIDASTTAEYMGRYLLDKKDITVITNNMALVMFLSEYNIHAICLGGEVVEKPSMLSGSDTVENARHYHADKTFFSTGAVCMNGTIAAGGAYHLLHQTIMENAEEVFCLADHGKIKPSTTQIRNFDEVDYLITDFAIDTSIKEKFSTTKFVDVSIL